MHKLFGFSLWYFLIGFVVLLLLQGYFGGRHVALISSNCTFTRVVSAGDGKGVTQSLDGDRVRDLVASHRHTRPPVVAAS